MSSDGRPSTGPPPADRRDGWRQVREAYGSGEAVWTLLLGVVGGVGLYAGIEMGTGSGHDPLGGNFFPVVISTALLLAVAAILLRPMVVVLFGRKPILGQAAGAASGAREAQEEEEPDGALGKPLVRVAAMAGVSIAYVALMGVIGYIPSTMLAMAGALWILQVRRVRSLIVGPVVMSVAVYYVFTTFLYVRLP